MLRQSSTKNEFAQRQPDIFAFYAWLFTACKLFQLLK